MFIGEYQHNIDQKGRLAVPSKFRKNISKGAVVTRGIDNCLFLYTNEEWKKLAEKLSALPTGSKDARAFARLMLAGAMDVEIDGQGRITLPAYLREYAGLEGEVVVAGLYSKIEIWNTKKWTEYKKNAEKDTERIAEHMGELGV